MAMKTEHGLQDRVGERFGKRVVLEERIPRKSSSGRNVRRFLARCDCGSAAVVSHLYLLSVRSRGYGCSHCPVVRKAPAPPDPSKKGNFLMRKARAERGLSQAEVAERAGVATPIVSHFETQKFTALRRYAAKGLRERAGRIARVLGLRRVDVLGYELQLSPVVQDQELVPPAVHANYVDRLSPPRPYEAVLAWLINQETLESLCEAWEARSARDMRIFLRHLAGELNRSIAADLGLTRAAVGLVVQKERLCLAEWGAARRAQLEHPSTPPAELPPENAGPLEPVPSPEPEAWSCEKAMGLLARSRNRLRAPKNRPPLHTNPKIASTDTR